MYVVKNKDGDIITYSSSYIMCEDCVTEEIPDEEFSEDMLKVTAPEDNLVEKSEIELLKEKVELLQQTLDDILLNGGVI